MSEDLSKAFFMNLKVATAPAHKALEEKLDLFSPRMDLNRYVQILQTFLNVYDTLENLLENKLGKTFFDARRKTPAILADLMALGVANLPSQLNAKRVSDVPVISSRATALGVAYVMEGATLGGQIISRHFQKVLRLSPAKGLKFFSGYGDETAAKWTEFRQMLSDNAQSVQAQDEIIVAAMATFQLFLNEVEKT